MFARLRDNRQRVFGAVLWAVAIAALVREPPGNWRYVHLAVCVASLTWGFLFFSGAIGVHPTAVRRRRSHMAAPPAPVCRHAPLEPRVFRYGSTPWRRAMAATVCAALGVGQIALGGVAAAALWTNSRAVATAFGVGLALWGLILCDYARRYLRVCIRVDAEGITSQLYYRVIRMRWDEVVALVRQRCVAPMAFGGSGTTVVGGLDVGVVYLVYSPSAKFWFSDALVDRESLVRILAEHTGLPWERGDGTSAADAGLGSEPERLGCLQEFAVTNHRSTGKGFRSGND